MPPEESKQEVISHLKLIIDGFDEAAKGLAAGTISRRRALEMTGMALLGGGLLAKLPPMATAPSIIDEPESSTAAGSPGCRGEPAITNRKCPIHNCGGNPDCFCAQAVNGKKWCVDVGNAECPKQDECDRNQDCRAGEVCIEAGGCCGHRRRNYCAPLCN
jgi:hypothetical protein